MTHRLNLQQELDTVEVKRFEKTMSERYGRNMALRDVPLKNFVDATTGLLATKVNSLLMRGALDEAGFYGDLINVYQLDSPIAQVPIISTRDFVVRTGKMKNSDREESGGKFTKVTLDTSNEDKFRYAYLRIDQDEVNQRNFDFVGKVIEAAGRSFAKNILSDITSHYVSNAGNSEALGGDLRFVAIMKAIGKNKDAGFGCSAIVVNFDDYVEAVTETNTGGAYPWLLSVTTGQPLGYNAAENFGMADGLVGKLFGRVPVFVVSNDANLLGNILAIDVPAGSALGFAPGGEIKIAEEIDTIDDLIEAKVSAKYDIGLGNSGAIAKVTGA